MRDARLPALVFPSKRDVWLITVLLVVVAALLFGILALLLDRADDLQPILAPERQLHRLAGRGEAELRPPDEARLPDEVHRPRQQDLS